MKKHSRTSGRKGATRSNSVFPNPRQRMLANQAEEGLRFALANLSDPVLEDIWLQSVQVDFSGALVATFVSRDAENIPKVEACLERVQGLLRNAIGEEVHRKQIPKLRFSVRSAHEQDERGTDWTQ